MHRRFTSPLCLSTLLLLSAALLLCTLTHAAVAPPSAGSPHSAYVQMQMVEISKIDGVEQAFHADFYMLTTWAAPLAGTPFNGTENLSAADLSTYFWAPQLEFINERDAVTRLVDEPFSFLSAADFNASDIGRNNADYALPPGYIWITEDQRYICDFTTDLGMQDFPFDSQYMQFLIESYWSYDEVRIKWAIPTAIDDLVPDGLNIVGWTFVVSNQIEQAAPGIHYKYNDRYYARLTVRTELKRSPYYYLSKIVAGVMLLVYMCVWIFSLAVDEADRQMGTLQIFAGLVTFLFVASGDTPKVPYQTRLDVFMLWSFFNVAFMLFIHGSLYYWRECDVEDLLEEREREGAEGENKKGGGHGGEMEMSKSKHLEANWVGGGNNMELGVASPSDVLPGSTGTGQQRVFVNDPSTHAVASTQHNPQSSYHHKGPISHIPTPHIHTTTWRLREDEWRDFTLTKWFAGLHATRKWDATFIPFLMVMYSIGVAIIFLRPVTKPT